MQIIKYNRLIITIILIGNLISSCSKEVSNDQKLKEIHFLSQDKVISVKKYSFYIEKGGLYLLIENDKKRNEILKSLDIDKISFITKDTTYSALPYDVLANELPKSTFSFTLKHNSKKMHYYKGEKEELILIGLEKQIKLLK